LTTRQRVGIDPHRDHAVRVAEHRRHGGDRCAWFPPRRLRWPTLPCLRTTCGCDERRLWRPIRGCGLRLVVLRARLTG
jgi:hypothetical protein